MLQQRKAEASGPAVDVKPGAVESLLVAPEPTPRVDEARAAQIADDRRFPAFLS